MASANHGVLTAACVRYLCRLLPWNRFSSSIPPSWAEAGAFPQLETL